MPLQLGLSSRPCYGSMCKQPPAGVEYPLVGNSSCRLCLTTNTLSAEHPHTYDSTISRRFWSAPADATFMQLAKAEWGMPHERRIVVIFISFSAILLKEITYAGRGPKQIAIIC